MKTYRAKTRVYNTIFNREIERRVTAEGLEEAKKALENQWQAVNELVDGFIPNVDTGMKMEIVSMEEERARMSTLDEAKRRIYAQIDKDQLDPELVAFTYGQLLRVKGYVAEALLEALSQEETEIPKGWRERHNG